MPMWHSLSIENFVVVLITRCTAVDETKRMIGITNGVA
jgi:hypothetical protein